ncbi:MAG: phosphatase PAP2 family protein [Polyangiaceae bacterium]|nr:phosphatase PAP2 family protein [Polyangiaceae bacterium]
MSTRPDRTASAQALVRYVNVTMTAGARRGLAVFALQDRIMLAYQGVVAGLAWSRGASQAQWASWVIAATVLGCVAGRAAALPARVRGPTYRAVLVGVLLVNYLMLRDLLPIIRPDSVDGALLDIDVAVFGVEPSLWLERWNRAPIVEWFSFFYLGYFPLIGGYALAVLWILRPGRHTAEFALGSVVVYCGGQLGYLLVPAFGPIRHLAPEFAGPVQGGYFWGLIEGAVASFGAMKDVFPSVHTAASVWLTIFAYRQAARDRRWRWPARLTGFTAANIVVSTVLLRWHYAIDVVAGLGLAIVAGAVSRRFSGRAEAGAQRQGTDGDEAGGSGGGGLPAS